MKFYIMLNTQLRTAAKNEFEEDFFKLMNNSVFGKIVENIRNHKNMKLLTSRKENAKYVMKPNFKDGCPFSKEVIGVVIGKTEIKMNKPVYLGQTILNMSKTLIFAYIYIFYYDYMQPKYQSTVKLCYMDTDSFVYGIEANHFYKGIAKDIQARFYTSIYSNDGSK